MTEAATDVVDHLSDLALDRLITDELAGDELEAARAHLSSCDACRARETALREDRAAFERSHLADAADVPGFDGGDDGKVVSLAAWRRGRVTQALGLVGTVAAAALLFLVLPGDEDAVAPPGERTKGGVKLSFFVKDAAGVRAGASGEVVHPGDQLRFVIKSDAPGRAAVLSRDGAGAVSVYAAAGDRLVEVGAGEHAFDDAIELDDVLGEERLYGFFCETAPPVSALEAAVVATPELPRAPRGCVVDVLTLDKRR
jgi:hypothetical protein